MSKKHLIIIPTKEEVDLYKRPPVDTRNRLFTALREARSMHDRLIPVFVGQPHSCPRSDRSRSDGKCMARLGLNVEHKMLWCLHNHGAVYSGPHENVYVQRF